MMMVGVHGPKTPAEVYVEALGNKVYNVSYLSRRKDYFYR